MTSKLGNQYGPMEQVEMSGPAKFSSSPQTYPAKSFKQQTRLSLEWEEVDSAQAALEMYLVGASAIELEQSTLPIPRLS